MTTTIATVAALQLRSLITDLLRTAGNDDTLPMLMGIRLHTDTFADRTVLVGFSTDRFTMGQVHIDATGALPEAFLPSASCKRALAVLKLIDPAALLELTLDDGHMAFSGEGLTVRVSTKQVEFPRMHRIVESLDKLTPEPGVVAAFNPQYFARFAAIAKGRDESMHVGLTTKTNAASVTIGDQYRGLIMPTRKDLTAVPWFLPASELAAIEKVQADKAVAELKEKRSAAAKKAAATRAAKRATQQAPGGTQKRKAG